MSNPSSLFDEEETDEEELDEEISALVTVQVSLLESLKIPVTASVIEP